MYTVPWMQCKLLLIKMSAKCINGDVSEVPPWKGVQPQNGDLDSFTALIYYTIH